MEPRLDILPNSQRNLWPQLGLIPKKFVLYCGTAIAPYFGHRESIDFDFFSSEPFDGNEILDLLLFKNSNLVSRTPGSITSDLLICRKKEWHQISHQPLEKLKIIAQDQVHKKDTGQCRESLFQFH